jgi:hypothetical protein
VTSLCRATGAKATVAVAMAAATAAESADAVSGVKLEGFAIDKEEP